MKKVAILMSTYNGGAFLADQIRSLQNQTFKNWYLYIRDDGSKDKTIDIIKQFIKEDKRIIYLEDNQIHLGPKNSFFKLLTEVNADYYFFCDQDDVWLPQKLELMINRIKLKDDTVPQLVYCGLNCVDKNLNYIKNDFEKLPGTIKGKNRFIGNDMPGCVTLFNTALRNYIINNENNNDKIIMHDWWISLIAQTFGEISFVNKKLILYRQHENNSVGAGKSGGFFKKLFRKDIISKQKDLVTTTYYQSKVFYSIFHNKLTAKDKEFFKFFIACKDCKPKCRRRFLKKYELNGAPFLSSYIYRELFIWKLENILDK